MENTTAHVSDRPRQHALPFVLEETRRAKLERLLSGSDRLFLASDVSKYTFTEAAYHEATARATEASKVLPRTSTYGFPPAALANKG